MDTPEAVVTPAAGDDSDFFSRRARPAAGRKTRRAGLLREATHARDGARSPGATIGRFACWPIINSIASVDVEIIRHLVNRYGILLQFKFRSDRIREQAHVHQFRI